MITELNIANFRVFQENVNVRFRPITVITGHNATGKSTILDFLELLHHSRWPAGNPVAKEHQGTVEKDETITTFGIKAHNYNFHSPRRLPDVQVNCTPEPGAQTISYFQLRNEDNTQEVHRFHTGITPLRTMDLTPLEQDIVHAFTRPLADITRVTPATVRDFPMLHMLHTAARNEPTHHRFFTNHLHTMTGADDLIFNTTKEWIRVKGPGKEPELPLDQMAPSLTNAINLTLHAATMSPVTTMAAEHPEIYLDPLAQLEAGTLFADLWKDKHVFSIIETQSDYILLRLRRLVANGRLKPHDISFAFFDHSETSNGPIVMNIDVRQDGSLSPGLPMSFFGANVTEALHMGAGA